jgi:hypothetical protein
MHCGLPRVVESNAKAMSFPAHRGPPPSENSSSHLPGKQGSQEPAASFFCSGRLPHLRIFEGTVRSRLGLGALKATTNDQTTRPQERPFKLVAEAFLGTHGGQAPALRHTTKEHPTRAKPSQVESKQSRQGLSFRALTALCYIARFLPARRLFI